MDLLTLITFTQAGSHKIDQPQDKVHYWKSKYQQLNQTHLQLEQQLWCDTCRSTFEKDKQIELYTTCSHRLQKQE